MVSAKLQKRRRSLTIDERIEALTHSVELLSQMHQDNERKYEERFARMETLLERIVGVQETLARIVNGHEQRITDLERKRDQN
jgi:flagellar capping protein FliD